MASQPRATSRDGDPPPYSTRPGSRFPPGATSSEEGVNFCVFSRHATRVELLLYAAADSPSLLVPLEVLDSHGVLTFEFNAANGQTGNLWIVSHR